MNIVLLLLSIIGMVIIGKYIVDASDIDIQDALLYWVFVKLSGMFVSVPLIYLVSIIFQNSSDPIGWGMGIVSIASMCIAVMKRKELLLRKKSVWLGKEEIILIASSVGIASWLMYKSFRGGATLLIGSNEIFDMGHNLSIIRSFSLGDNIPFTSPFIAGAAHVYHFMFYFLVGMIEHTGIPIVWALNIPSIMAFASLLIIVYFVPKYLFGAPKKVGWIAVGLVLTHSTLTWAHVLMQKGLSLAAIGEIWRLPKYPFAGPFDGSVISIFYTLNVFVNQRHLAFGMSVCLLLLIYINQKQKKWKVVEVIGIAIMTGTMMVWHMSMLLVLLISFSTIFILRKQWRVLVLFLSTAAGVAILWTVPWFGTIQQVVFSLLHGGKETLVMSSSTKGGLLYNLQFWGENIGILPIIVGMGIVAIKKKNRMIIAAGLPLLIIAIVLGQRGGNQMIDQKFLNILLVLANSVAAIGLVAVWNKKGMMGKIGAIIVFGMVTCSGVIDIIIIKNDFAYPVKDEKAEPVIAYIKNQTPRNAVFLSYADIFDPVTLAGRKNYYGFFHSLAAPSRDETVKKLFELTIIDKTQLAQQHISYVLLPKWEKTDFAYTIDMNAWRVGLPVVFEDDRHVLFQVK